jgi:hypothetical protein
LARLTAARSAGHGVDGANQQANAALGVAAFDARFEPPHALARDFVMGMDGEGCTESVKRGAGLVGFFVDEAKAGERAKMAGLALQGFLDGGDGAGIIVGAVGDVGAAVPGFGEIGGEVACLFEKALGQFGIAFALGGGGAFNQNVDGRRAGIGPMLPDLAFDPRGGGIVGRLLKLGEKRVELGIDTQRRVAADTACGQRKRGEEGKKNVSHRDFESRHPS